MQEVEFELLVAAFIKMARGEFLSLADAQRVLAAFVNTPPKIDTQNQGQAQQVMAQAREGIQRVYFGK